MLWTLFQKQRRSKHQTYFLGLIMYHVPINPRAIQNPDNIESPFTEYLKSECECEL